MKSSVYLVLALGAAHCLGVGCGDSTTAPRPAAAPAPGAAGPDVIAWVNGVAIRAGDLRQTPKEAAAPRTTLRDAVRFELLVQEARRRGLDRAPAVERTLKRALANLFVRRAFGDTFAPQDIPEHLVKRAYQLNWMNYDRPRLVRISFFAVPAAEKGPPDRRRAARKLVTALHARLRARGAVDLAEFDRIGGEAVDEGRRKGLVPSLQKLTVERVQRGLKKPAVDAGFALRAGRYSGVVSSPDAFFIVFKKDELPELRKPLPSVADEIRAKIFEEARQLAFEEFVAKLEREHDVRVNPRALELLANLGGDPQ